MFAHVLLAAAIVAVWLPPIGRVPPWTIVFGAALVVAVITGVVTAMGCLSVALLIALLSTAAVARRMDCARLNLVLQVAVIAMLFGFGIQRMPGFVDMTVVSPVRLTPDATTMRVIARFDTGLAALFLVALHARRVTRFEALRAIVLPTGVVAVATTAVVLSLAVMAGYVRFEPKWPAFTPIHLAKTLLITAVLEEAFFRGVLQDRLARLDFFKEGAFRRALPVLIVALLFGLAHLHGGWLLACMATIAGFGYGLAYSLTGRIEAPIAVHFLVNATHFIAFTYPSLAAAP